MLHRRRLGLKCQGSLPPVHKLCAHQETELWFYSSTGHTVWRKKHRKPSGGVLLIYLCKAVVLRFLMILLKCAIDNESDTTPSMWNSAQGPNHSFCCCMGWVGISPKEPAHPVRLVHFSYDPISTGFLKPSFKRIPFKL